MGTNPKGERPTFENKKGKYLQLQKGIRGQLFDRAKI